MIDKRFLARAQFEKKPPAAEGERAPLGLKRGSDGHILAFLHSVRNA
jgi:hypothetical protein